MKNNKCFWRWEDSASYAVILTAEFDALRREVEINIEHQKEIVNFSILTLTAMVGLFGIIENGRMLPSFSYVFLVFPLIFLLLAVLYADKTIRILRTADYIHNCLRKRIIKICGIDFWQWEIYKSNESSLRKKLAYYLDRLRWFVFFIPAFSSLCLFYLLSNDKTITAIFVVIYTVLFCILLALVIYPMEETGPIKNRVVDLDESEEG